MTKLVFCAAVTSAIFTACAPIGRENSSSERSPEQILAAIGRNDVAVLIVPPVTNPTADAVTRGLGKTLGEASLPRSIRLGLADVRQRGMRAYVGGTSAGKTEWALSEALLKSASGSLRGLVIYTNIPLSPKLREAAEQAGAQLLKVDG